LLVLISFLHGISGTVVKVIAEAVLEWELLKAMGNKPKQDA